MYGYIIIFTLLALVVLGWVTIGDMSDFLKIIGTALLVMALILIPISRTSYHADIESHKELQATITRSRQNEELIIERATLQKDIVKANRTLAKAKYYYTIFRPYVPSGVMEVEPVE